MGEDNPVDRIRIRIKLGDDEFEAEGPNEIVAAHLRTWERLRGGGASSEGIAAAKGSSTNGGAESNGASSPAELFSLDTERRVVTLSQTVRPMPHADAALLLLFGFHRTLGGDGHAVPVTRLKAALAASGYPVERVDRMLAGHIDAKLIRKRGHRIGITYELTEAGFQRADAWLQNLGATAAD